MFAQTPPYNKLRILAHTRTTRANHLPHFACGASGALLDFVSIMGSAVCSETLYARLARSADIDIGSVLVSSILVAILMTAAMGLQQQYDHSARTAPDQFVRTTGSLAFAFAFLGATGVLLKSHFQPSLGFWFVFFVIGLGVLLLERRFAPGLPARISRCLRIPPPRVALVGSEGAPLSASRADLEAVGLTVVGNLEVRRDARVDDDVCLRFLRAHPADRVVVIAEDSDAGSIDQILELMRATPLPVHLLPPTQVRDLLGRRLVNYGIGLGVEMQALPQSNWGRIIKRSFDLAVATVALVCLSLLFVAIAIAIKLDSPGPIIFRQTRVGFDRRAFNICKFRTMNVLENGPVVRQASRDDPRVTRIGKWLRRTSLDELPQLLNVIAGDMSLVGPRPHAVAHDQEYSRTISNYNLRHRMKPGITGWAQVNGHRGPTPTPASMQARISYDTWYIEHWSFAIDIEIILRTAFDVFHPSNVY